jgi:quercetin dioxygenase-like cupin family protein
MSLRTLVQAALILLATSLAACAHAPPPAATPVAPAAAEAPADAPDPLTTDPDKYALVFENQHVRVLRYHDTPGAKTSPHHHRRFVLVVQTPFRRKLRFADGTVKERDFQAGEVVWMPAQTHSGENTGTTDTNVLLIEVK